VCRERILRYLVFDPALTCRAGARMICPVQPKE